jgi:drug/metabolite transporter (DMT)-like permease
MLPAFLTTVLFAISAVSANRMAKILGGVEANFWRITLATLLLGLWAHSFGRGVTGAAFPFFLLSGCVGFGIGDLALYQALPRIGSRLTIMLVHCLAALFAGLAEWLWLGTKLTSIQMISSATILVGVSLALAPSKHLALTRSVLTTGILYGIGAAFGQGFGAVLSRKAYQVAFAAHESIDGMTAAYQRIIAGWVVAAISIVVLKLRLKWKSSPTGPDSKTDPAKWRLAWYWVVINAFAGPTFGVSCFQWALATTPTGIVLPIVATTPLVVIPFARVMEGEETTPRSLLGAIIAVAGAVALTIVR